MLRVLRADSEEDSWQADDAYVGPEGQLLIVDEDDPNRNTAIYAPGEWSCVWVV